MKEETGITSLKNIRRKYQVVRGVEVMLWTMAIIILAFFSTKLVTNGNIISGFIAGGLGSIGAYFLSQRLHLFSLTENQLAFYLNRKYPRLQESADLLLKKGDELSTLQQLQRNETMLRLQEIYPTIKLPHQAGRALIALGLSVVASILLTSFLKPSENAVEKTQRDKQILPVEKQLLPPSILASTVTVSPPVYTQKPKYSSPSFNTQLPEGSKVKWDITFKGSISMPEIIFSARDTISLIASRNKYSIEQTFTEPGFYQFTWKNPDGSIHYSDYYKLDVVKDNAPSIQIQQPAQHLELSVNDSKTVNLTADIADDYGLAGSSIVATVSKGSGEAIKFREEKLRFDSPDQISGKKVRASRILDLTAIGLEPGDELYYYIEASDNKLPRPNRTRTETYFITLEDTSSLTNSVEASLGVDLMPEYFRSQRQIIIDSEKLLREKKAIPKQRFNERSNELGYDQKVLRLRYGEFLGEEFESGVGPRGAAENNESHEDEDVRKKFGHQHDRENEHNMVEDKKSREPTHKHESGNGEKTNVLEEFVHAHDSDEEATFFVQSIKAKLKATVTIMWDAELYLRLYQPEKSLPYQYKALKLLKEISQDSRIYVHRAGFDPPPLKEDSRLTGELSEINNSRSKVQSPEKENIYPAISEAVATIEHLIDDDTITISQDVKRKLANAGREVATLELKQPGQYLKTLSWLNDLIQDKAEASERRSILMKIRSTLWKALPRKSRTPAVESGVMHELDREFLEKLKVGDRVIGDRSLD